MRRKKSCVYTNLTGPVSSIRLCYFLSVKMQIEKKVKHRPLTKDLDFHKITGPTLILFLEKKIMIIKTFHLPTNHFSMLEETQLFLCLIANP